LVVVKFAFKVDFGS